MSTEAGDPGRPPADGGRGPVQIPPVVGPAGSAQIPAGRLPGGPTGPADVATDEVVGPQLARAVLDAARSRRQAGGGRGTSKSGRSGGGRPRGYSGPGPDPRDPQPFGSILARLVKTRGWSKPAAEATVFGDWPKVVGVDLASHSRPVKLENGELTVEAESTAWATQMRLLAGKLLIRISREVGANVVTKLHIHGPVGPTWARGPRRVRGRGPRDTYG